MNTNKYSGITFQCLFAFTAIVFLCGFARPSFSFKQERFRQISTIDSVPNDMDNVKFERVEIEASFPGGETAWKTFLQQNLRANVPIKKKAPVGKYTVMIQFIVDLEGNLSDMKALTNHGYGMEKEVIRLLGKSPKWKPAYQNGRPVKAYRKQPVIFMISQE